MSVGELKALLEQQQNKYKAMIAQFQSVQVQQPQPLEEIPEISSVAVRLPTFWTQYPELWFA